MTASEARPTKRALMYLVAGEMVVLAVLVIMMMEFGLGWVGAVMIGLAAAIFPLLWVRKSEAYAAARGDLSPAMQRYNRRMMVASVAYVAGLMTAVFIADRFDPGTPAQVGLALLASAGVLLMLRAMWRLLAEEKDEYLRSRLVGSALSGLGVLLVLATVWGFLEQFGAVPHAPGWVAVPIFAFGVGVAHCTGWMQP